MDRNEAVLQSRRTGLRIASNVDKRRGPGRDSNVQFSLNRRVE
jgi:hypothetical protein